MNKPFLEPFICLSIPVEKEWDHKLAETRTDLCGCVFEIEQGIIVCVKRCPKHSRPKRKRPLRAKAECVRPWKVESEIFLMGTEIYPLMDTSKNGYTELTWII